MDMNIMRLREAYGDQETIIGLTATYHNLVRMWAEI
jgi:PKHD-type hydroxylase